MEQAWAADFLKKAPTKHILVAGEVGIDEYVWGETTRISPEAPVPVIEVESSTLKLGMAANVAQNILSLGGKVTLVGVVGQDQNAQQVESLLDDCGIKDRVLIPDASRPTLRKMRVIAGKQHVVRVDYEKNHPLDSTIAQQFRKTIESYLPKTDGIIVQDYGKGLWTPEVMEFVQAARAKNYPIFVDPCRLNPPELYQHCSLMSPNVLEAVTLAGGATRFGRVKGNDDIGLRKLAELLLEETQAEHMIITCGADGMVSLSRKDKRFNRIPTYAREVFDVTGAGDTVISTLALAQVMGLPLWRSMQLANAAAGIVVGRIGASCVTPAELTAELQRLHKAGFLESQTSKNPTIADLRPSLA